MTPVVVVLLAALLVASAQAQGALKCQATLKGWAYLPASAKVKVPSDAPSFYRVTGRFAGPGNRRNDTLGAIKNCAAANPGRCTEYTLPFADQAVQGFSGIKTIRDGAGKPTDQFWLISDNGLGSRRTSPDSMLFFHKMKVDWAAHKFTRIDSAFLHDPDRKVPFVLRNEETKNRYLSGADFDIESIQPIGSSVWIGDEFGPYLIEVSVSGRVRGVWDVPNPAAAGLVRSPDNDAIQLPNPDQALPSYNLQRSRGFEGMATWGDYLYPMLEGPLYTTAADGTKGYETRDGKQYLRILKFNMKTKTWVNGTINYGLEVNGNSIGDFNMINERHALILERDNFEGDADMACTPGYVNATCWEAPARFKRAYLVDLGDVDAAGFAKKVAYIDLLDIKDPNGVSPASRNGVFKFPFQTIEDIDVYDASQQTIVVGNDNNFPFSMGRALGKADNNEVISLQVPGFFTGGQGCSPA
ncbi:hypothetical protein HYH02_014501 [Chlamydomonas schloesseri]|uniref:Phytase-like domain-containing protein n=1 Tax=Chlamydomonas schloesseri TaxID=2026947 RepID=A0A835SJ16_9CHLO|nr:hypothetical protein HYH02_014501 [Chlamydomonas schloesseri]|eukprot:KAG2427899.1 hypothetical protein HYH02_014501 [Chlamydomonas schloesseri]